MFKLIVCDLDETLLKKDGTISKENINAVKLAKKNGIKFVINTGRSIDSVQKLLTSLELNHKANEYVISCNGGIITENSINEIIYSKTIANSVVKAILELLLADSELSIHVTTLNEGYIVNPRKDDLDYMQSRNVKLKSISISELSQLSLTKVIKIVAMHPDRVKQIELSKKVLKKTNYQVTSTFSSNIYVEFTGLFVNKGTATKFLSEKLNIMPNEVIAIGDNFNDLAMLEYAGFPATVSNGVDEIKRLSKYVSPYDHENGVSDIITHLLK
ncbi:HMP-PP hydrolase (Pyridoxal phosphatase) Cof [Carnobacterium maltaromaticum]|uniref:Cof-type HAD-IIB family hydrolase n=1 Tax=Carnobacterium maltaromaticum TaxID=2751 RepID=UPI00191BA2D6|nr:HAD family hydrolase [Carnobacterium maltaromaticum]CAD5901911.1 HMP-PP hydrolase (Pyridoxal phosphatase) Cof [Carnobacterium maltaromaticum]